MTDMKTHIERLKKKQELPKEDTYVTTIIIPLWVREYRDKEKTTLRQLIEQGIIAREAKK